MSKIDLGSVSAFDIAVKNGYAGTEADWVNDIANASENAEIAQQSATQATSAAAASRADYTEVMSDFDVLSARMDEFTSLEEGSTTGDAELADIRVGYDGTTYQSAGTAVRTQIRKIANDVDNIKSKGDGLTETIKQALLQIASKVAYIDEHGEDYYNALYESFYPTVASMTATYTQSGTVYSTTPIDSLKSDLTVTVRYADGTTSILDDSEYALSGTLSTGTSVITVSYGRITASFTVLVTGVVAIDAVYNQSGTVADTDSLSTLIPDLTVTASLSDGSTVNVPSTEYVLSCTLVGGSSTITVTYGTLTDTFTVNVTEIIDYTINPLEGVTWHDGYKYDMDTGVITAETGEHCTDKFAAQSCIYILTNSDTSNNRYVAVFAWGEDDNYLGQIQYNASVFSLKKGYKYAIKAYNTETFDSSTISFMPKDNSSTAASQFSIKLSDFIGSISGSSTKWEINVSSIMSAAGVTVDNLDTKINKCNYMTVLTPTSTNAPFVNREFTFWFYNINTMLFRISGTSTVADVEAWITANNPEIVFNS